MSYLHNGHYLGSAIRHPARARDTDEHPVDLAGVPTIPAEVEAAIRGKTSKHYDDETDDCLLTDEQIEACDREIQAAAAEIRRRHLEQMRASNRYTQHTPSDLREIHIEPEAWEGDS